MSPSTRKLVNEMSTLTDLLSWRSQSQPNRSTYTFLEDGEASDVSINNRELEQQAQAVGAYLQSLNSAGERILLLLSPGLDYIAGFFGCMYAGAIAVPVYPPRANRRLSRLQSIVKDAQPKIVLTTGGLLANLHSKGQNPLGHENLTWVAVDEIDVDLASQWQSPSLNKNSLAFLQYTSGSTAAPKGVMVSHHNLLQNLELIAQHFGASSQSRGVAWLPPYHDMGLIGGILQPLYSESHIVLMSPVAFLQQPMRWLRAISHFKAHINGGPNFAYELCLDRITSEAKAELDLSSWDVAFTGAEPVRAETLDRFAKTFESCGFRREAFYPCYGMAEATLFISGGRKEALPVYQSIKTTALQEQQIVHLDRPEEGSSIVVGCGQAPPSQEIVIVNSETCYRCQPDQVGEIWVRHSSSIAQGYWNQPKKTQAVFHAHLADTGDGPFLRTGDLGFLHEGELFITGRLKDLIIIRGRNYYPQDIELTVEQSHPVLRPGSGAAFSVKVDAQEQLVVVQEVHRRGLRNLDVPAIVQAIRQAIVEHHDLKVYAILLLKTGSIPKTSSGKIQRYACKAGFQANTLKVVGDWLENPRYKAGVMQLETDVEALAQHIVEAHPTGQSIANEIPQADGVPISSATVETWLTTRIARHLNVDPSAINIYEPFSSHGLDSAAAVSLSGELEEWLGRRLSPTLIYDYPSIIQLAQYLATDTPLTDTVNGAEVATGFSINQQEAIAIVGMGCRFPGADSPEAFWELLGQGQSAVTQVSKERLALESDADAWGGFLEAIDRFDAAFFGIAPREAEKIDPQQRWLLEVAWQALEFAGQSPAQLSGSQAGVFIGISNNDYARRLMANPNHVDAYVGTGNALSIAANRLSYVLNLQGPSLVVDTACSSSLVALHLACQSLRRQECNLALAGGVNALLSPELTEAFSQAQMMAADGRCKTFDIDADGYIRGEGCGVVVLKRLSEARANGDLILAIVRGSATNQDGRSNGLTAPNGPAQQAVIRQALADANVAPAEVQYVETHGTGTPLGDPIEVDAIQAVLSAGRSPEAKCYLGSVKTNVGHLESAAGIAGLIKGILALQHQQIPPHLNLKQLNPYIKLNQSTFNIATEPQHWSAENPLQFAGVSSFGFGGTNAHVILEAASGAVGVKQSPHAQQARPERPWQLLTLSAKTEPALQELIQQYQNFLSQANTALADICFTANTGRAHFFHRVAIATSSKSDLQNQLAKLLEGRSDAGEMTSEESTSSSPKIAFLFTGQGAQYVQMGRQLYDTCPSFQQILKQCDEILHDELGESLLAVLYPPNNEQTQRVNQTRYTQPALFALGYALAELWRSWGVKPDVVMGHSVGEYVAACVAGVFDLATGLKLIAARARLMQSLPAGGKMAVVFAEASQVERAISSHNTVTLAAINGPKSVVISGQGQDIDALVKKIEHQEIRTRELSVSHAFHSPLMAPMLAEFEQTAEQLTFSAPQIPLITNVTGELWPADTIPDTNHWRHHVSAPVQFYAGMHTLKQQGCNCIVEIGPHPTLLGMGQYCWSDDQTSLWLPSLKQGQPDWPLLLESLAQLYVRGVEINWCGFEQDYQHRRVALPTYPFQRQSYWLSSPEAIQRTVSITGHPLLGQRLGSALKEIQFESRLSSNTPNFLEHHQVFGVTVLPATGYLEMALAAGAIALKTTTLVLEDVVVQAALMFAESTPPQTVQTIVTPADKVRFEIFSVDQSENPVETGAEKAWTSHAKGNIRPGTDTTNPADLTQLQAECREVVDVKQYYESLWSQGLEYGVNFQAIEHLWCSDGQALGYICLPKELAAEAGQFHIHPVLLDACFQTIAAVLKTHDNSLTYLPTLIKQLSVFNLPEENVWCHVQLRKQSKTRGIQVDLSVWDSEGRAVASIKQLHLLSVTPERLFGTSYQSNWHDWLYQVDWRQQDHYDKPAHQLAPTVVEESLTTTVDAMLAQRDASDADQTVAQTPVNLVQPTGRWLIFADDRGVASSLLEQFQTAGANCFLVNPGKNYNQINASTFTINPAHLEDFQQLLQEILTDGLLLQGVVHLWSLNSQVAPHLSTADLEAASVENCGSVLHLVQALGRSRMQLVPLWLVTQGAVALAGETLPGLAQSLLWGMGRTLALEHPEIGGFRVDLDPDAELAALGPMLFRELHSSRTEAQVALRRQGRYVARLQRYGSALMDNNNNMSWRLAMANQGTLENLQLQPLARQAPLAGEVEIQVRATGLNFLDVLDALGLLPFERGWFGAECAGEVVAVGQGVEEFQIGDTVVAIAPASFSQYVTVTKDLIAPKPVELSFEAAATIPVNFLTAYYALWQVAKLSPGDRVLIHAAAGGTGMAAVQLAQLAGAEIFATASPEKWETLRSLGVTHIMNSRTLEFVEEILTLTEGQGVDCVFNSLAGEFIPKSLSVLSKTGCFIEIGKNNIWDSEQVYQIRPNAHYAVVDLFQYSYQDPPAIQAMLQTLFKLFSTGDLKPLPLTVFPIESVTDAFRYMQQAKHVGKVVVTQPAKTVPQPLVVDAEGTYLITGGLGGLGLLLAEWLAAQGAQHIMLLSRHQPRAEVEEQLSALKAAGVQVIVVQADVTQSVQLAQALAQAPSPLRGVIHAAGALADGILQQMPWQQFSSVLGPKVMGAWNLHQLTCDQSLDFFILFSSAASLLGSPGQANYAAANTFLDALAYYRQSQGLAGLSLNWGVWTDVGLAAKKQITTQMAFKGVEAITPQTGEQTFMTLFSQQQISQIGVLPLNWPQFLAQWPTTKSFFADFIVQETAPLAQRAEFLQQLETVPKTEWQSYLAQHLRQQIATVLGFSSVEEVDLRQGFFDLGMDSLTAVELKNRLQASLDCSLPTTLVFDYPTGRAVVDYLAQTVLGLAPAAVESSEQNVDDVEAPQDALANQVETLSETEIAALLQQELVAIEQEKQA
ncbi:MAG: SDR family NAD(P)-dependent oxidoreductase [Cyanobacteria bacterium P01_H01_bin.21]